MQDDKKVRIRELYINRFKTKEERYKYAESRMAYLKQYLDKFGCVELPLEEKEKLRQQSLIKQAKENAIVREKIYFNSKSKLDKNKKLRNDFIPVIELERALLKNDWTTFFMILQSIFKRIPYSLFIDKEAYYHTVIHLIFELFGFSTQSEFPTSMGRIDIIWETKSSFYIFELKTTTAKEALIQVKEKCYGEGISAQGKSVFLIAIAFDMKKRSIKEWIVEEL
jgi:hypothetical protein